MAIVAFITFVTLADARKVTGTVTSGSLFLEGVIVTDGSSFTTTNFKGKFSLDIKEDAEYVYIVTPSGYVADWSTGIPAFYQNAEGVSKFLFDLQRTQGGSDYNIIAMADPQTRTPEHFEMFAGKPLSDLTATAKSLGGLTVGLALGDITWDEAARLDDYKSAIVKTGVPFYPVVGNHDKTSWKNMGPENYAFFLGKDLVIVLDNVIYGKDSKFKGGYTDQVLAWVKGLMAYVPAGANLYIAQHIPTLEDNRKIYQADRLLDIVRGHKVTILSGHSHENNNFVIERNIVEHNIASICGSWWESELCCDGTPSGYKVFTKVGNQLSWYYKPVGHSKKHMAQAYGPGENAEYPNSILVNVWDWDQQWKVEWYEDGVNKGKMDPLPGHHLLATPSRYAERVMLVVQSRFGQKWTQTIDLTGYVEENRICSDPAPETFKALAGKGVNGVVMDLSVSMDGKVKAVGNNELTIRELIDTLAASGCPALRYNLEMHTVKGKEEGHSVPYYHYYADYVMDGLWDLFLGERLMVTGSDYRALNHLNSRYPEVDIAFKVAADVEDVEKAMARLKFKPKWISFHYSMVDADLIKTYAQKDYCVSVWGMPDEETKNRIKALGPDAVIY